MCLRVRKTPKLRDRKNRRNSSLQAACNTLQICLSYQTALLGEAGGAGAAGGGGGEALRSKFESKINTASRDAGGGGGGGGGGGTGGRGASQSVRSDMKKSEKSVEKTSKHTGRDDRATVEQVRGDKVLNIPDKVL